MLFLIMFYINFILNHNHLIYLKQCLYENLYSIFNLILNSTKLILYNVSNQHLIDINITKATFDQEVNTLQALEKNKYV